MNKTTVRLWEAVIAALNNLNKHGLHMLDGSRAAPSLDVHVSDMKQVEKAVRGVLIPHPCNRATWEVLIRTQIPYHLGAACSAVLRQLYTSSDMLQVQPSTSPQLHSVCSQLCMYIFEVLDSLLRQAAKSTVPQMQVQLDNGSVLQATPANAVGQQLQQSGLLELLPRVLSGVAADLQAHMQRDASSRPVTLVYSSSDSARDATAGACSKKSSSSSSSSSRTGSLNSCRSTASGGSGNAASRNRGGQPMVVCNGPLVLPMQALHALSMYNALNGCWPGKLFQSEIAPDSVEPTLHLVAVVLQYLDHQVITTQQPSSQDLDMWGILWEATHGTATRLFIQFAFGSGNTADEACSLLDQTTDQLDMFTGHLPTLALLTTCTAYSGLLLHLGDLPDSSSCRSSSRGSSGGGGGGGPERRSQGSCISTATRSRTAGMAAGHKTRRNWADRNTAWEFACSQQPKVPASHCHLLQSLGCSSKTFLWLAARHAGFVLDRMHGAPAAAAGPAQGVTMIAHHMLQAYGRVVQLQLRHGSKPHPSSDACALAPAQPEPALGTPMMLAAQAGCMPADQQQLLHFLLMPVVLFWAANLPDVFLDDAPASSRALYEMMWASSHIVEAALAPPGFTSARSCPCQLPSTAGEAVQQAVLQDVLQSASQLGTKLLRQLRVCSDEHVRLHSRRSNILFVDTLAKLAEASQHADYHAIADGDTVCADVIRGSDAQLLHGLVSCMLTRHAVTGISASSSSTSSLDSGNSSGGSVDAAGMPAQHSVSFDSTVEAETAAAVPPVLHMVSEWAPYAATIGQLLEADVRLQSQGQSGSASDMSLSCAYISLCLGYTHAVSGQGDSTQKSSHGCGTYSSPQPLIRTAPLYLAAVSAGGSSTEQQQLFCIMCSLFKVASQQLRVRWISWHRLWTAAMYLVETFTVDARARHHSSAEAGAIVPWLVLLGRSWLHLALGCRFSGATGVQAAGSSREADTGSTLTAGLQQQQQQLLQQTLEVAETAPTGLALVTDAVGGVLLFSQQMLNWLQSSGGVAALTDAGYLTDNICSQLQQLAEQGAQLRAAPDGPAPAALSALTPHLEAAGLALCTLPIPYACNNPHCTNLSGLSELHLVNGSSCKCGGCHVARYCSKACQQQHWKQHKRACKAMAAAGSTQD